MDFLKKINNYLQAELIRKKIDINYGLLSFDGDSLNGAYNEIQLLPKCHLRPSSKSNLPSQSQKAGDYLKIPALTVLRRGLVEILTSMIYFLCHFAFAFLLPLSDDQKSEENC